jgi:hypothetical protein
MSEDIRIIVFVGGERGLVSVTEEEYNSIILPEAGVE